LFPTSNLYDWILEHQTSVPVATLSPTLYLLFGSNPDGSGVACAGGGAGVVCAGAEPNFLNACST